MMLKNNRRESKYMSFISNTAVVISLLSVTVALLSAFISFWNISRQRKANLRNEEEKFKRELNLKTNDEFLEVLYETKKLFYRFLGLEHSFRAVVMVKEKGLTTENSLNEMLWEFIESEISKISELRAYYEKREIILYEYKEAVETIVSLNETISSNVWELKTMFIPQLKG